MNVFWAAWVSSMSSIGHNEVIVKAGGILDEDALDQIDGPIDEVRVCARR